MQTFKYALACEPPHGRRASYGVRTAFTYHFFNEQHACAGKMRYPVIWALLLLAVSVDCQRKLAQAPAAPEVTLSVVGNTCEHVVVTPYQMVAEQMISFRQATSRCKMQRRMQIPTLPK